MDKCSTTLPFWHMPDIGQALAAHERLVHWVVRRQWLGDLSYPEALQAGRIALWRALRGYDPLRGYAFSTYAVPAITRAVWRAVAQARPRAQEVLTPHPPQAAPDLEEFVETSWLWAALYRLVLRLPHPLYAVIVTRYGLHEDAPKTFAAIGHMLGVTRQRAQQLHVEALLWLAHPAHSIAVRRLLDRNTVSDYQAYLLRLRTWLRARRGQR